MPVYQRRSLFITVKDLVLLTSMLVLGLFSLGCKDPILLMNDSERAMWRSQTGISDKEAAILQVKHLSRDLETCIQRREYFSLSDAQIKKLVKPEKQEIYNELVKSLPLCKGIVNGLILKLEQAYELGNRRKQLYYAIVDGQAISGSSE